MRPRFWIVIAALLGASAVALGAYGAHSLPDTQALASAARIFRTGQFYHLLHAVALLGVALVIGATEGRCAPWSTLAFQGAAAAFTFGVLCFSGGIYYHVANGFPSGGLIVPIGGSLLILGWLALAAGALGVNADRR